MPAIRLGAGDLLEYNPKHSLLICRECQYAIQKNALESHLLRHKIYRGERQRLLSSIAQLDLLEPHQVPLPAPGSPPVDTLPIFSGHCCIVEGCRHLTASSKRMKRHWSDNHGLGGSIPLTSSFARPAKLQTFFRGTKLRYFEVTLPTAPLANTNDVGDGDNGEDNHEGWEEEGYNATTAPPQRVSSPHRIAHCPSPANFNLETLAYFHHFGNMTSLTLPGAEDAKSAKYYWQTYITVQALQRRWLMCGLLAISAYHLATLVDDTTTERIHLEQGMQLSAEFSAGLEQTTECDLDLEAAKIEGETKQIGEQIKYLLRCAQLALAEAGFDYDLESPCGLTSIMSTVRGCVVPDSTLHHSSIRKHGHGSQENLLVQGLLHVRDPSYSRNPHRNSFNDNTPSVLLNLLGELPGRIAEGLGRPESAQDVFATLSAISTLAQCCDISFACDEPAAAWQGVATWLANVPDHFHQMIQRHEPAALVVLAYWAMLVKRAERIGCWFLKRLAKIIVLQVVTKLTVKGHAVVGLVEGLVTIVED